MLPVVFALVPAIVGSAILIGAANSDNKGLLLFAVYLTGTFGSALSSIYAYNSSNVAGNTKKVCATGTSTSHRRVDNVPVYDQRSHAGHIQYRQHRRL
jgi:ACS family allantoate permease-like MFS transporter